MSDDPYIRDPQKHLFFVLLYKSSDGRLGNYDYLVKKTVRQHQLSAPLVSPWLDMSSLAAGELAPVDMGGFGGIRIAPLLHCYIAP